MKDAVSHKSPKVMSVSTTVVAATSSLTFSRKKLQFSLLNAQDTVKISEFEITHRDLYTPVDRLPVQNGVLDRRLVGCLHQTHFLPPIHTNPGNNRQERILRDVRPVIRPLCRSLCLHQACRPSLPHRLF